MANDMVKDLTSIIKNGGRFAHYKYVTVNEAGVITPVDTNWHAIVYRLKSQFKFNSNAEKIYGEAGEYLTFEAGNTERTYVITSAQFDSELLNFYQNNANPTTFMQMFVSWGKGRVGGTFEVFFPLVQFEYNFTVDLPGRKPDISITILDNLTQVTPINKPTEIVGSLAAFVTEIGQGFKAITT